MELRYLPVSAEKIATYELLFRQCFPDAPHLDQRYLQWMYGDNPDGQVLGFDAWDGETLAAHYVCIPAQARIAGEGCRVLLSLNTATAPAYQGKGLFTRLAAMTYERAAKEGYRAVYGVANASSTPGFVRKLGFSLVCPLQARVGVGRLVRDWRGTEGHVQFQRTWSGDALAWRLRNPAAPVAAMVLPGGATGFYADTQWPFLSAYAEHPVDARACVGAAHKPGLLRVYVGLFPDAMTPTAAYFPIPAVLKPSPLNFIYKDLRCPDFTLDAGKILLSFIDFDAF